MLALCGCCDAPIDEREQLVELNLFKCLECGVYNRLPRRSYDDCIKFVAESNPDVTEIKLTYNKYIEILNIIESYGKGALYDVGCGLGGLVKLSQDRGWESYGNDIRPEIIKSAKKSYDINLDLGHFELLDIQYNKFQAVVFHHGIEHLLFPKQAIRKAINILKTDGIIYLMHPRIPEEHIYKYVDKSNSLGCHYYEWTFEAFEKFIKQFKELEIIHSYSGEVNLLSNVAPIQEWILKKC